MLNTLIINEIFGTWFKYTGNNFHVTGIKTDLELLR